MCTSHADVRLYFIPKVLQMSIQKGHSAESFSFRTFGQFRDERFAISREKPTTTPRRGWVPQPEKRSPSKKQPNVVNRTVFSE